MRACSHCSKAYGSFNWLAKESESATMSESRASTRLIGFVRDHPGVAITAGVASWYVIGVLALAGFDRFVAVSIARETDPTDIGFAIVILGAPIFYLTMSIGLLFFEAAGLIKFYLGSRSTIVMLFIPAPFVLLSFPAVYSIPVIIAIVLMLIPWIRRKIRQKASVDESNYPLVYEPTPSLAKSEPGLLVVFLVAALLLPPFIAGPEVLPWEVIEFNDGAVLVAKVVAADDESLILLTDTPRQFGRITIANVAGREFCEREAPTILEILGRSRPVRVPPCPGS